MDRVIATQSQVFGVAAGSNGELLVDPDRSQLRVELLEGRECLPVLLLPESIQAPGSRQSRPALWVGKDARRCGIGAPQSFAAKSDPSSTTSLTSAEVSK